MDEKGNESEMEYHILIVWNKAEKKDIIFEIIRQDLEVRLEIEYCWDVELAKKNYATFYGERLADIEYKVSVCGDGPFNIFVIEDEKPVYDIRKTSSGMRKVNTLMFDTKTKLRALAGGGHRVHASDNSDEANQNCVSLFGVSLEELLNSKHENHEILQRNITGALGWDSWEQLFACIDRCTKYVVLRNFETLENVTKEHGDVDLLVENYDCAKTIIAAEKVYNKINRVLYTTTVDNERVEIDLRSIGDGYYASEWENDILLNRYYIEKKVYVPQRDNYRYSLLYHALVHKPMLGDDYKTKLMFEFGSCERKQLESLLENYMLRKGYSYSMPKDKSVYIHPNYYKQIKVHGLKRLIDWLKYAKYNY